jgi:hypothetical protein
MLELDYSFIVLRKRPMRLLQALEWPGTTVKVTRISSPISPPSLLSLKMVFPPYQSLAQYQLNERIDDLDSRSALIEYWLYDNCQIIYPLLACLNHKVLIDDQIHLRPEVH